MKKNKNNRWVNVKQLMLLLSISIFTLPSVLAQNETQKQPSQHATKKTKETIKKDKYSRSIESWIKGFQWQKIESNAIDIGVSARDVTYVVSQSNRIYRWRSDRGWRLLPGYFIRVAVDNKNKPWAVDEEGMVRYYNGLWWDIKGENSSKVIDVGASTKKAVYILTEKGQVRLWIEREQEWKTILPKHNWKGDLPKRIAVDSKNNPWVVTQSRAIYRYKDKSWIKVAGKAMDIAAGADGIVGKVDQTGKLAILDEKKWKEISGRAPGLALSIGQKGTPWYVEKKGNIWVAGTLSQSKDLDRVEATTVVAETEDKKDQTRKISKQSSFAALLNTAEQTASIDQLLFILIRNARAQDISIGIDGSVYSIQSDGQLLRWSNQQNQFLAFPGILARVAVDPFGLPWGINSQNKVFRIINSQWQEVQGVTANNIAIGSRGGIYITSLSDTIYRFNVITGRFEKVNRLFGQNLAVDPDGNLWLIRSGGGIFFCVETHCQSRPGIQGQDIAVGPDGSIFATSTNNELFRFQEENSGLSTAFKWVKQRRFVSQVSVGPQGFPWVIDSSDKVLRSAIFERDESGDQQVAFNTRGSTTGLASSSKTITITRAIRFERIPLPSDLVLSGNSLELFSGASGNVFLRASGGSGNTTFIGTDCLNDPLLPGCADPAVCGFGGGQPQGPGQAAPGCINCNDPIFQQSPDCTVAVNTPAEPQFTFTNGYCLEIPNAPECAQPRGIGHAGVIDCTDSMLQTGNVCVLVGNGDGGLLVSSSSDVWQYDNARRRFIRERRIPEGDVGAVLSDDEDRLWFVISDNEVQRELRPKARSFRAVQGLANTIGSSNIAQLASGGELLYYLSTEGEAFLFAEDHNRFLSPFSNLRFTDISADNRGQLWAVLNNRVSRIVDGRVQNPVSSGIQNAEHVHVSQSGEVYIIEVLDQSVLKRFNFTTQRFERVPFNNGEPRSIATDSAGRVWVINSNSEIFRQR